jgi:DNA invertase Pin-like site-specific DNA recombinase
VKELIELSAWLASKRGSWTQIARSTGVSTRTIYRIVNDPKYSVNLSTFLILSHARASEENAEQAAA